MFVVYLLIVHVAFVLLLPVLLVHPKLREGFLARLGFLPEGWPGLDRGPVVWFHGASAGDLLAIEPMIDELKKLVPDCSVLVTTVTNSGMKIARQGHFGADAIGYLPYDLPWAVKRVVRRVRPDVLVLEYAEVWPALIRAVDRFGARIMITNGRFDERVLGRYRFLYRLIGNPLQRIDLLCMRDQAEAEHALAIGADPERVRVTGNTKFDSMVACRSDPGELHELARALGISGDCPVWVAGSTHEGEEGVLLDVFVQLRERFGDLRMVIAPRYVERAGRVAALADERGLSYGLRTSGVADEPVAILDTVGELAQVYRLASVVFVGGSFVKRGGQNIIEPAACGKPVMFGPYMENFRDSVRALRGRGGIQVSDPDRLRRTLADLVANPGEAAKLGGLALEAVQSIQGASLKNARAVVELLRRNDTGGTA